jgi:hypothetical protein
MAVAVAVADPGDAVDVGVGLAGEDFCPDGVVTAAVGELDVQATSVPTTTIKSRRLPVALTA